MPKAAIACRLICRLLALTDAAEKLTPEAIPAAAAALKGKERDPSESQDCGVLEGKSRKVGSFIYKFVSGSNLFALQSAAANTAILPFSSACSICRQPKLALLLPTSV